MATRFYGWEAGTAPITPAVDAGWESSAAPFARKPMHTGGRLGDTALTTTSGFSSTTGQDRCHRQWISRPMAAGNAFTTSTTFKAYAQVLESAANDNIRSRLCVRILSEDGSTVRATLLAIADYSTGTEWSTTIRNKAFATGDASAANYTTVDGDRLVVEWGHNDSSGATISASSRWGSQDAAQSDLPEDETTTTTTARPWFECSLDITFKAPTVVNRYVNTASTAGGDGTTNNTSGATRAFATLAEAFSAVAGTDWPTQNQQLVINCSGATADAPSSTNSTGTIHSAPDCFVRIVGDATNALQYDTSKYRLEPAKGSAPLLNNGVLYYRVERLQAKANAPDGSGGYNAFNMAAITTPEPGDCRVDRVYLDNVINNANTGGTSGFAASTASPNLKLTITNSIAANFTGTGATHKGFLKSTGATVDTAWYNCAAYNCGIGFHSQTNDVLAKNCGAVSCADGWSGTLAAASTNNASDLAADATGTNARNSVTPSFTSAGSDFHLAAGDTAWKDQGVDLSADSRLAFSTDGDGDTRSGTWDIGADEQLGTLYTQTLSGTLDNTTMTGAIVRKTNKPLAGTMGVSQMAGAIVRRTSKSPSGAMGASRMAGAIVKQTAKTMAGAMGSSQFAGALVKQAGKILSGGLTPGAGTLTARANKVLAGSLTSAGALVLRTLKVLAGGLTPGAGDLVRQTQKILAGALTSAGTLSSTLIKLVTVSGSLTPSGDLTRQTGKALGGTLTPGAGDLVKLTGKVLAGSLTPAGDLVKLTSKTMAGSLTPGSGDLVRQTNKSLAGTLTPGPGTVSATSALAVTLSGSLTPSGTLVKLTSKTFDGGLTPAGALTKQTAKTLAGTLTPAGDLSKQSTRTLAGTLTPSGTVAWQTQKVLSGGLTPGAGTLTARAQKVLAGTLTTSGAIVRSTLKVLAGVLTPSGAIVKQAQKGLAGSLTPAGDLTPEKQGTTIQQSLSGSLTPTGDLVKRTGKVLGGSTSMSGAITKLSTKSLAGSLTPSGTVSKRSTRTLAGSLSMSGALVKRTYVTLAGVLAPIGDLLHTLAKTLSGVLFPSGDLTVTPDLQPTIIVSARIDIIDPFSCTIEIESSVSAEVEVV